MFLLVNENSDATLFRLLDALVTANPELHVAWNVQFSSKTGTFEPFQRVSEFDAVKSHCGQKIQFLYSYIQYAVWFQKFNNPSIVTSLVRAITHVHITPFETQDTYPHVTVVPTGHCEYPVDAIHVERIHWIFCISVFVQEYQFIQ